MEYAIAYRVPPGGLERNSTLAWLLQARAYAMHARIMPHVAYCCYAMARIVLLQGSCQVSMCICVACRWYTRGGSPHRVPGPNYAFHAGSHIRDRGVSPRLNGYPPEAIAYSPARLVLGE